RLIQYPAFCVQQRPELVVGIRMKVGDKTASDLNVSHLQQRPAQVVRLDCAGTGEIQAWLRQVGSCEPTGFFGGNRLQDVGRITIEFEKLLLARLLRR